MNVCDMRPLHDSKVGDYSHKSFISHRPRMSVTLVFRHVNKLSSFAYRCAHSQLEMVTQSSVLGRSVVLTQECAIKVNFCCTSLFFFFFKVVFVGHHRWFRVAFKRHCERLPYLFKEKIASNMEPAVCV